MSKLWQLADLETPWSIHVIATLRVAEHLVDGPRPIAELAAACGASPEALGRVLRHLVTKGLFEEPEPDRFALNDEARAFLDADMRLGLDLDGFGGRMANAWSTLLSAVRTGKPAYAERFGRPFWDDLSANPKIAAQFDLLMGPAGHGPTDPEVLVTGGWDRVRTVVDVGGGIGYLLAAVLQAHPHLQGTLVDFPATVAKSQ